MARVDGREQDQLRSVSIKTGVNPYAEGSAEIRCGNTVVLATVSVEDDVPRWMENASQGWITAEYGMLPRSTHSRMRREASGGKQSGRTVEIQRLIGRSLRQAVSLSDIPGLSFRVDCDVLAADGGTRCASITGAWVALVSAIDWCVQQGRLKSRPNMNQVAAVSLGGKDGKLLLDLCYEEDSSTDFDLNLVFCGSDALVEVQGTGEKRAVGISEFPELFQLGKKGILELFQAQSQALEL